MMGCVEVMDATFMLVSVAPVIRLWGIMRTPWLLEVRDNDVVSVLSFVARTEL